jgi:predicted nucleic acid-binding protein
MTIVVPDASVCAKLFITEHDSEEANTFFTTCAYTNTRLVAPDLLIYEVAESIRYCDTPLKKVFSVMGVMRNSIMSITSPDRDTWYLAEEMTQQGHPKSGFPSMYDSIYHAMAIKLDAIFLTADKRHYAKTKQYDHIKLLEDWESIFIKPKK